MLYLIAAGLLGAVFLGLAWRLWRPVHPGARQRAVSLSLLYLALLSPRSRSTPRSAEPLPAHTASVRVRGERGANRPVAPATAASHSAAGGPAATNLATSVACAPRRCRPACRRFSAKPAELDRVEHERFGRHEQVEVRSDVADGPRAASVWQVAQERANSWRPAPRREAA